MITFAGTPVLVTGGCGYVGSHTVSALLEAGFDVSVLDDLSSGSRAVLPSAARFFEGSVENSSLIRGILQMRGIRSIIHLAGSPDAGDSALAPMRYYRNNLAATRSLIESALTSGVHHFILSSSAEVYGWPPSAPLKEGDAAVPRTPYAMSELMKERVLIDSAQVYGASYSILRYPGAICGNSLTRSPASAAVNAPVVSRAIQAALGKRDQIMVPSQGFPTPDGSAIREFVHVEDVASAHVLALCKAMREPGWHNLLNCGIGTGFSTTEVISMVETVTNLRVPRLECPIQPDEPAEIVLDVSRIREDLGWSPAHAGLRELVEDAYRWELTRLRSS